MDKKEIIKFILSGAFTLLLSNMGLFIYKEFPENKLIGVITALISFAFLYISYYAVEIGSHGTKIQKIEK